MENVWKPVVRIDDCDKKDDFAFSMPFFPIWLIKTPRWPLTMNKWGEHCKEKIQEK